MNAINGKRIKLLAFIVVALILFIGVFLYLRESTESKIREQIRGYNTQVEQCARELEHKSVVPTLGGGKLITDRIWRVGLHFTFNNGACGVDISENLFWWSGSDLVVNDQPGFDSRKVIGWLPYKVTLLSTRNKHAPASTSAPDAHYDQLTTAVLLNNYPGMELRLLTPPPSETNKNAILNFYVTTRGGLDDSGGIISCHFPEESGPNKTTSSKLANLLSRNRQDLENIDFADEKLLCDFDAASFNLGAGLIGRVFFDSASLKQAPKALPAIRKYIIDSTIND